MQQMTQLIRSPASRFHEKAWQYKFEVLNPTSSLFSPTGKDLGNHLVKAALAYADILAASSTVYPAVITNNSCKHFFDPDPVAAQYLTRPDLVIAPELTLRNENYQHQDF